MEAVWRTTSSEGADLDLDGLGQLILPGGGDNAWPEAIMDAPSFPNFFASPPIFLSDATTATATTNNCLGQPSVAMASKGAMVDVGDPDQLVSGDNASAAIASSSSSFFASTSAFLLDATTNGGAPASANTSSIQPSISTMSRQGIEIDLDGLGQALLPCDNAWLGATIDAPSSPSLFASPSIFPSYATTSTTPTNNTCLGQPSITMESQGAMFDLDLDHLLSSDSPRLQVATIASSSPSFFDSPSTFPLFDATTSWETPASTNTYLIQPNISTTSSHGPAVLLERLFSGDNTWSEVAAIASSSTSFFDYPSSFPSDATANGCTPATTNTCLIQPSIPSSQGAAVDSDHLREQPLSLSLSGHKPWPELTFDASSLPSLFAPSSIKKRFNQALSYISESLFQTHRCNDVLLQVWVPAKLGDGDGRLVLTTWRQSYWFCTISGRVKWLRNSSQHQLITNVVSESTPVGLPGRVFMSKVYSFGEPAVSEEQSGYETLGLPVFEKGNNSCLGVIELTMPTRELNFKSEVDAICRALQAVNLMAANVPIIPRSKFNNASYKDALPEVLEVLRAACIIHALPLAQTWATCGQQGKRCRRHSDENCRSCISTIDPACYVKDPQVLDFHYASSELQLLLGQGVAGKAFTTNQLCFLPNIASSSEHEYPLSHHAKIFRLKGAVAIRLRYTPTRMGDLVLEFFLPTDCEVKNEQKAVLNSLWGTVQSLCRTLRMVIDKEMEDDAMREFQKNKTTNKRKRMPRRSLVWKSFTEVMVGDTVKAKCNYCGLELCCDSTIHGTSSLKSHMKRCKLNPNNSTMGPL